MLGLPRARRRGEDLSPATLLDGEILIADAALASAFTSYR
jgi:hypothetical protein